MAPAKTSTKTGKVDLSAPPKRNQSAYFLFASSVRPEIMKENPGMRVTEVAKLIGQKWKTVEGKDKEKFTKLAAKDKERFEKEKEAFIQAGGEMKANKPRSKAASRSTRKAPTKEESEEGSEEDASE